MTTAAWVIRAELQKVPPAEPIALTLEPCAMAKQAVNESDLLPASCPGASAMVAEEIGARLRA